MNRAPSAHHINERPRPLSNYAPYPLLTMYLSCLLLVILPALGAATCYFPDGTASTDNAYQPCNASASASMCCATNRSVNTDLCLPNGVCYDMGEPSGYPTYWRETCTDSTWKSDLCLGICNTASTVCRMPVVMGRKRDELEKNC